MVAVPVGAPPSMPGLPLAPPLLVLPPDPLIFPPLPVLLPPDPLIFPPLPVLPPGAVFPPVAGTPPVEVDPPVASAPPVDWAPPLALAPPLAVVPPDVVVPPVVGLPPVADLPPVPTLPPFALVPPVALAPPLAVVVLPPLPPPPLKLLSFVVGWPVLEPEQLATNPLTIRKTTGTGNETIRTADLLPGSRELAPTLRASTLAFADKTARYFEGCFRVVGHTSLCCLPTRAYLRPRQSRSRLAQSIGQTESRQCAEAGAAPSLGGAEGGVRFRSVESRSGLAV